MSTTKPTNDRPNDDAPEPLVQRRASYTTGTLALIFGVCPRTAAKMMDDRVLMSYRLPTGLKERRVRHEVLCDYICAHYELGIDLDFVFGPGWDQPLSAAEMRARRKRTPRERRSREQGENQGGNQGENARGELRVAS